MIWQNDKHYMEHGLLRTHNVPTTKKAHSYYKILSFYAQSFSRRWYFHFKHLNHHQQQQPPQMTTAAAPSAQKQHPTVAKTAHLSESDSFQTSLHFPRMRRVNVAEGPRVVGAYLPGT